MTNYSRTTLRELKKRYLSILKKCLLANLGLILLSTPSMADSVAKKNDGSAAVTITDTSGNGAELLCYLKDSSYHVITDGTFSNIVSSILLMWFLNNLSWDASFKNKKCLHGFSFC